MDFPVWSLNLGLPTVIETEATPFNGVCYPNATTTLFQFPGAQGPACREADLVRRRPDASRSRGARERNARSERRRALRRQESQAAALQRRGAGCCRRRSTIPTARRRSGITRVPHGDHEMNWVHAIKGTDQDLGAVRLRRQAHRDHAARDRLAARELEAPLRRRHHARHQQPRGE